MENLRLHFGNRQQPDRALATGVHRVVRESNGSIGVGDSTAGALLAQFCIDRRGLWLQVAAGIRGIHVNGRPVQRMALVRAGDSIYVDGAEFLVQASHQGTDALPPPDADNGDPRIVMRGVGGKHHGRAYTLSRPCQVGSAAQSSIRIEDANLTERHAQLERRGDRVLLTHPGGGESQVNGVPVREALLASGDQVAFGSQHRFVVEVPWQDSAGSGAEGGDETVRQTGGDAPIGRRGRSMRRWPWLLLAALLLGAMLSALLLFGAG